MKVKAKETCFVDGTRRRAGEVFDTKLKKCPSYLEEVEKKAPAGKKPKGRTRNKPQALSELAKATKKETAYGQEVK
jgi:hypothetical protein